MNWHTCVYFNVIVYFSNKLFYLSYTGRVFYTASAEKFTYSEAVAACTNRGAQLATTGQLYLAWQGGMDVCNAGWLGDRSVRYPINIRRPQCGGGLLGVRTVYLHVNQTGYPFPESRYDAFCYTGKSSSTERVEILEVLCPASSALRKRFGVFELIVWLSWLQFHWFDSLSVFL